MRTLCEWRCLGKMLFAAAFADGFPILFLWFGNHTIAFRFGTVSS